MPVLASRRPVRAAARQDHYASRDAAGLYGHALSRLTDRVAVEEMAELLV